MSIPLTITIDEAQGFLTLSKVLTLGSTYEVTVAGVAYPSVDFTITNHDGDTVAASVAGALALDTQLLRDQWPTNERCPSALTLHVYAVADDAVVGDSAVAFEDDVDFVFAGVVMEADAGAGRDDEFCADADVLAAEFGFAEVVLEGDAAFAALHIFAGFGDEAVVVFDHGGGDFLLLGCLVGAMVSGRRDDRRVGRCDRRRAG